MNKPLQDLIEIIHFTEKVSAKIHGVFDETKIYRIVKEEFAQSKKYRVSTVLLTEDESKLRIAMTSIPSGMLKKGEKASGLRWGDQEIDLSKSAIYRQVIKEGKTLQVRVDKIIGELFPLPLAKLITKVMGYEKKKSILTPLKRHGKIIGVFAVSSPKLAKYFVPSVKNLAQHISAALELADEYAERKRAEEELRKQTKALWENRAQLEQFFENAPVYCYMISPDGKILSVNQAALKVLGYKKEELVGKPLKRVYAPEVWPRMRKLFAEWRKTGRLEDEEMIIISKRGELRTILLSAGVVKDKEGNVLYSVSIQRDITERKRAEEELKKAHDELEKRVEERTGELWESEERFRAIFEQAADSIVLIDAETGGLVEFNNRAYENLGYTREEFQKLRVCDFEVIESAEDVAKHIEKIIKEGPDTFETKHRTKEGEVRDILVSSRTISIGGKVFIQGIWRDITERKEAEEALKKSREQLQKYSEGLEKTVQERTKKLSQLVESQKEFIAHISHELRTPLAVIKAAAEVEPDSEDVPLEERCALVNRKVNQITQILNNLTLISRLDIGQEEIRKTKFGLRHLLEEVSQDVLREAHQEHLNPDVKIRCSKTIVLDGDRVKTSEVLTNLLRNAMVHSSGQPHMFLKVKKQRNSVQITVGDNNPSIPKEDIKKIFEKFYRGKQTRGGAGLGLGLYISKRLVVLMGGKIWVEHRKGVGNRFVLELPAS